MLQTRDLLLHEIPWQAPEAVFARFAGEPHLAFLDSNGKVEDRSRWSFLCAWPFRVISVRDRQVCIDGEPAAGDPCTVLAGQLAQYRLPAGPMPFPGGAVGLMNYELGGWLERLPCRHGDDLGIPEMSFGLYDLVLAFDRAAQRAFVLASGFPETAPEPRLARAEARIARMLDHLRLPAPAPVPPPPRLRWRPEITAEAHQRAVGRVLDYIRAGDIFQANLTMRFLAPRPPGLRAEDLYLALRARVPAPFGAFLACGDRLRIASVSPERFLQLQADGRIETRPIKGTRRRAAEPMTDMYLAADLAASAKDRAENLMIVDLMRNDIGRVAEIGSVRVPSLQAIETFATVHHMVSVVEARLLAGKSAVDLLRAAFPGGSITGAPKIRAMQIIDEVEAARRGPYCGCVVRIGFDGAMDSSIVIRTLVITPEQVVAQAGGGIVADSSPREEWEEVLTKIRPLLVATGEPA